MVVITISTTAPTTIAALAAGEYSGHDFFAIRAEY
jgi:hypothetical protein